LIGIAQNLKQKTTNQTLIANFLTFAQQLNVSKAWSLVISILQTLHLLFGKASQESEVITHRTFKNSSFSRMKINFGQRNQLESVFKSHEILLGGN